MNHNANDAGYPIGMRGRCVLAVWSLFLLAGFALALHLEPDARGFGTHQQLGLPPCTVRVLLGIPCPSCGMTTSFSHFIRGQFVEAFHANAAGLLLATACALQIPWCWNSIRRSRLWKVSNPDMALLWLVASITLICLIQWALLLIG